VILNDVQSRYRASQDRKRVLVAVQVLATARHLAAVTKVSSVGRGLHVVVGFTADRCLVPTRCQTRFQQQFLRSVDVAVINVGELNESFEAGTENHAGTMLVQKKA
jgi:hypothetical protein